MFDVLGKHSIAAKANRYTTIKRLTEGQLGAEVVKGIIEQIQCIGHLQLGPYMVWLFTQQRCCSSGKPCLAMMGQGPRVRCRQGFTQLQT